MWILILVLLLAGLGNMLDTPNSEDYDDEGNFMGSMWWYEHGR